MSGGDLIALTGFAALFAMIAIRIPIGIAMALVGVFGFSAVTGLGPALNLLAISPIRTVTDYNMGLIPMFVLMGELATRSGLSRDLFTSAQAWLGRFRGGLALATIGACGGFSAICGSSVATAATMTRVALPEMRRHGYPMSMATGIIAAGGTIGILIPPSVVLAVYGFITGQDVGALFIAAVRNKFEWDVLSAAMLGTMTTVGTIIWLVLGAVSFVGIFNLVGGGEFMRSLFLDLGLSALGTVLVMMLILMVLGTFMEWIAIVLITVPVFAPVIMTLAPDLGLTEDQAKIWFGILFVMNIQIYFLSPPFGPACFWLKSVAPKDVTLQEIFISVLPFIGLQIVGLLLVMFFPQIALFLPEFLN